MRNKTSIFRPKSKIRSQGQAKLKRVGWEELLLEEKATRVSCTDAKPEGCPAGRVLDWWGKEEFVDRGPLVSAQYWGHEPGWLEPKETAGVESWTCPQVQPHSSGLCLGIIIAMTIIHGGCTMSQIQRGRCLTSLSSHENPVLIPFTISKQLPRFALVCQRTKPVLLISAK